MRAVPPSCACCVTVVAARAEQFECALCPAAKENDTLLMLLRLLRDTDYRSAADVVRERFHARNLRRTFAAIWKARNREASLCIVHHTCLLGLIVVVQNKIEYVTAHESAGGNGLGGLLVCAVLEILKDDFKIAHLVTADNPLLR